MENSELPVAMVQHTNKVIQLLKDLKRSRWLPMYNEKLVKEVVQEIRADFEEMTDLVGDYNQEPDFMPADVAAGGTIYSEIMNRNKRCLLAYLNYRLEKIRALRWEVGRDVPSDKWSQLHAAEREYFHRVNEVLDRYFKEFVRSATRPLDLTEDRTPPKDLVVQIRAQEEDLGDIMTQDSGTVRLRKGWVHMVKRSDVEMLIRSGKVEHLGPARVDEKI